MTHYLFSLGLTNLYGMFVIDDSIYSGVVLIVSLFTSLFSWVPNIIDRNIGVEFENEGVLISRYRHPLSHSPWTMIYFLPFVYLAQILHIMMLEILISLIAISWGSHLLLDSLNPGGLPLGRQSVFSNHPVKHYKFHWTFPQNSKQFRIARIPFNDPRANKNLGNMGLFFFSLNFSRVLLSLFRGQ